MAGRGLAFRSYLVLSVMGALGFMLGGGLVVKYLLPGAPGDPGKILALTAITGVAMAWALWIGASCFRRLDEYHQAAGKFAWYWGGSAGMAASTVVWAFIGKGGLHWLDPADFPLGEDIFNAYTIGYMSALLPILAGFLAVRLWWRLAKR
jgi:hypothetical protein